ncbi:MAG: DUF1553 domain-containing protein [Acidobacteria bacterium]|nr:DUF1553 domain-containing protein [Acidobacteriota bacterium]
MTESSMAVTRTSHRMTVLLLQAILVPCLAAGDPTDPVFENDVKPLLLARCQACHSEGEQTSGFSVSSLHSVISGGNKHGKAVLEGDAEASPLIRLLKGQINPRMPLGGVLTDSEIARIENWIRSLQPTEGVQAKAWLWPFRQPVKTVPPEVENSGWVRNPVDRFTLRKLEEQNGLSPAPPASRRTLARRLYLDLVGMPPTPEAMQRFLNDPSPNAYEKLVDTLLADARYGERWGRHWLDLVRYGESDGMEGDILIGNAWRYRDWVIEAFNSDLPYDRFVTLQLAGGDEHSRKAWYKPEIQGHIPAGFLRLAPWDLGNLASEQLRQDFLDEVTTATGSIFLGLTLGCARCHDHKYDPIPARDYFRFQAFFNALRVPLPPNTSGIPPEEFVVPYKDPHFSTLAESKIEQYRERLENGPEKRELEALEQTLLDKLISKKILEAASDKLTSKDLELELARKDQKVFSAEEKAEYDRLKETAGRTLEQADHRGLAHYEEWLLKKLAAAYAAETADPPGRFRALTLADVRAEARRVNRPSKYFTREEKQRHLELSDTMEVLRRRLLRWRPLALTVTNVIGPPLGPGIPATRVLKGGDYRQPGEAVEPGFPSAVTGSDAAAVLEKDRYRQYPTRGRRMTLARWIASPRNPLTARVMVNRIWQQRFGRGIVGTPSDFGKNGDRPTHPELLDWLAARFVEDDWSVKAMHRLMVTSSTYRQSADNPGGGGPSLDPENRLLWRFNRRRLEAEAIRDSILSASGRLNLERRGPSVFPPLPEDMKDLSRPARAGGSMWEPNESERDARRRSVYIFQRRSLPLPMMASFDAPVFNESCERRSVTTTPLQALSMMNGRLVNEEATHLATRVAREAGGRRKDQVVRLFEIALNRPPDQAEQQQFVEFQGPLEAICRVMLNSNEFLFMD